MANHALLNNIEHKDLKVITDKSITLGDNQMCTLTFPFEFRSLQGEYPIFFNKNPQTDKFQPLAMFGFEQNENLYLNDNHWEANYIPIMIERGPFFIGFQNVTESNSISKSPVISIDLDNPRVNAKEGKALFLPHGGNTDYVEKIASILQAIHDGQVMNDALSDILIKYELLESFVLDVELNDGSKNRLPGFYTIDESKLAKLEANALAELHLKGTLHAIYMVIASLSNIRKLIDKKNCKL